MTRRDKGKISMGRSQQWKKSCLTDKEKKGSNGYAM